MTQAPRRTQAERKSATVARLVEATIGAIEDVGYHRASIGEICTRSGVSKGGLFRHFDSRLDLVVAAAEEVGRRHMTNFRDFRTIEGRLRPIDLVREARAATRHETNVVWFELLVAARTEPELRERLNPVARALLDDVEIAARDVIEPGVPDEVVRLVATSLIHMFDGESIFRCTYPRPELEEARLVGAAKLVESLTQR